MKATLLVADDNETVQNLYRRYFVLAGQAVHAVLRRAEAREALEARLLDAMLLDLNLPDGSGLDFVSEIRAVDPSVAVVLITGQGDVPSAVESMRRRPANLLTKPVDTEALKLFLAKAFELGVMRRGHHGCGRQRRRFQQRRVSPQLQRRRSPLQPLRTVRAG